MIVSRPKPRVEPFPVQVLKKKSLRRSRSDMLRVLHQCKERDVDINRQKYTAWMTESLHRFHTVELHRINRGWYLAYYHKAVTGPFHSKATAIHWFLRGGK